MRRVLLLIAAEIFLLALGNGQTVSLPEPPQVRMIDEPPDWVCEVLSPSKPGRDRVAHHPT